jgi:hypothetical protein
MISALLATFVAGAWIGPWINPWSTRAQPGPPILHVITVPPQTYDPSKGIPRPDAPRPMDPRQPEPRAVKARASTIRQDAAAIQAECQRAAGGNWDKWQADTATYRAALKARIDALKEIPDSPSVNPAGRYQALEGRDGFPLFEAGAPVHLNYLFDPSLLDGFRRDRLVVAAHRWLLQRGIDLIFVPVPKMTEVYMEHFLEPCPVNGIIAPQVRHTLLELLDEGVEVADGLPLLRSLRDTDTEYLYNVAETHWAPRAMRVMAKEIAGRIERYQFGARARYGLPIVKTSIGPYGIESRSGLVGDRTGSILTPEQAKRGERAQTTNLSEVWMQDGQEPSDDPASPVVLIGNSYGYGFRDQLIKELNLLIHTRISDGGTTEFFGDFLRQPELLSHCRVVVWITTEQHLTLFKPLPEPIMKTLESVK